MFRLSRGEFYHGHMAFVKRLEFADNQCLFVLLFHQNVYLIFSLHLRNNDCYLLHLFSFMSLMASLHFRDKRTFSSSFELSSL